MARYVLIGKDSNETYLVETEVPGRGKENYLVHCPWHKGQGRVCAVSPTKGIFYCFECYASGECRLAEESDEGLVMQESTFISSQEVIQRLKNSHNDEEWWEAYKEYLATPEWQERRRRVMYRAGHRCEGCGVNAATQVHHLTYKRVGCEMLFDLVAICDECHEIVHEDKGAM